MIKEGIPIFISKSASEGKWLSYYNLLDTKRYLKACAKVKSAVSDTDTSKTRLLIEINKT